MPYEKISKEEYGMLIKTFPIIDFSKLWIYEHDDMTTASQELSCLSGACEIEFTPTGVIRKMPSLNGATHEIGKGMEKQNEVPLSQSSLQI